LYKTALQSDFPVSKKKTVIFVSHVVQNFFHFESFPFPSHVVQNLFHFEKSSTLNFQEMLTTAMLQSQK